MNKQRRTQIMSVADEANKIKDSMELLQARLELIEADEEYAYDSMPDNLKYSFRGEEAEEAVNEMQNALDKMNDIIESLKSIA